MRKSAPRNKIISLEKINFEPVEVVLHLNGDL